MTKFQHVFRIAFLIILTFSLLPLTAVQAQSNEPPEFVKKAMQHLSIVLGVPVEFDDAGDGYDFVEQIYNDASLGCPAEGQVYTQQTVRGYDIDFLLDGVEYNYRVSSDQTIVILCLNGRPDPRSIGITVPTGATPTPGPVSLATTVKDLAPAQWYAWLYLGENDTLVLVNPAGEQGRIQRPKLPNENPILNERPQVALSRDGRFMVVAAELQTGVEAVGLYSLATATFVNVYQAAAGEEIHLGMRFGPVVKSPYLFNPNSTQYAVAFYGSPTQTQAPKGWKIIVFDVTTGNALYQLPNNSPLMASVAGVLPATADTGGNFFPNIVYFGNDEVHAQLIPFGTEGGPTYNTINWHPNANTVGESVYSFSAQDILPTTGLMLIPFEDVAAAVLPANGPFTSYNAIAQATAAGAQSLWTDATKFHFLPKWAANGTLALFISQDESQARNWNALTVATKANTVLPATITEAMGVSNGFLSATVEGQVSFHAATNPAAGTILWQPVDAQLVELGWSIPPGSTFALTTITLPGTIAGGQVVCPNTPPTRMIVGGRGQVTSTDGQPLRVRATPNGAFLLEMPEQTQFTVTAGPDCTGGRYTWYQVQLADGTIGWSAEGDLESYFMEPIQ